MPWNYLQEHILSLGWLVFWEELWKRLFLCLAHLVCKACNTKFIEVTLLCHLAWLVAHLQCKWTAGNTQDFNLVRWSSNGSRVAPQCIETPKCCRKLLQLEVNRVLDQMACSCHACILEVVWDRGRSGIPSRCRALEYLTWSGQASWWVMVAQGCTWLQSFDLHQIKGHQRKEWSWQRTEWMQDCSSWKNFGWNVSPEEGHMKWPILQPVGWHCPKDPSACRPLTLFLINVCYACASSSTEF